MMNSKERLMGIFSEKVEEWADCYADTELRTLSARKLTSRGRSVVEMPAAGVPRDSKVLDAGCATGQIAGELLRRGYEVWGLDITEAMIRYAQARYGPDRFGVGDIEQIAFPDNTFDTVVCLGVLGYLDRAERALHEIWRVLKPEGRAVIDIGGAICPLYQVERMLVGLEEAAPPRRALILTFHRVSENGQSEVGTLPIRSFAEYLEHLTRYYRVVSLSDK
jgi:ubiquinone/menaquinone biosynthesis C-methylase UbiE